MNKRKISKKQKFSLEDMPKLRLKTMKGLTRYSAVEKMRDKKFIARALLDCLVHDDVEAFKEILIGHLHFTNKAQFSKKSGISQRTLFRMLSPEGNPTLANVSRIIHLLCA